MYKTLLIILCSVILAPAYAQRATDTFSLYFDLNVPTMNGPTEKKIDLLVYNDKIINGSTVMIIGYADYLGTEGYNRNLSMQRAQNVKDYLIKYGIDANYIKLVLGKGEIERMGLNSKEGYPTDRRVDIVVNNRMNRKMQTGNSVPAQERYCQAGGGREHRRIKESKSGIHLFAQERIFPA
jgi:hypothetical protein